MKKINSHQNYIMVILIMLLLITTFVGIKYLMQDSSKSLPKTNEINNQKKFAIMVQNEDGYEEYVSEDNTWPGEGYDFKEAKCVDNKGSEVNSTVTYNDGKVTLKTNKTVFCTLYFDMEKTYSLTIHYWLESIGGVVAAQDYNGHFKAGEYYEISTPNIDNCIPNKQEVSGVMPESNLTIDVIYTRYYTLTINYVYQDGNIVAPPHIQNLAGDEEYNVVSPVIDNYISSKPVVSGIMPRRDLYITVVYVLDVEVPMP